MVGRCFDIRMRTLAQPFFQCLIRPFRRVGTRADGGVEARVEDLPPDEMDRHLLAVRLGERGQTLLCDREHTARTARAVAAGAAGAGRVLDLVRDGREDHVAHQLHHIARRPVFARLLIEATNQLLENRPHAVIIETGLTRTVFASSFHTGFGERVMSDEANLETACPAAAASAGHAARSLPHTTENSARTETTRQLGFIRKSIKKLGCLRVRQ